MFAVPATGDTVFFIDQIAGLGADAGADADADYSTS
jgi:hypothetical protein